MKRMSIVLVIALFVAAAVAASGLRPAQAAGEPVKIMLDAENNSGETGTATLTDLGNGKTMVDVEITGAPAGVSQPIHVHAGQCGPTLGKVVFPLTNLENGKSSTTIETTLEALMTGDFAINGHKSAAEAKVYVFCGNIPEGEAMMMAHQTATDEAMMMAHATGTTEAMMMAHGTATTEAMMMAHATGTTEAMMMAQSTATTEAMMMAHATGTTEAMMMAQATATDEAMMMAHATGTTEAMMMAEATATTEAMMMAQATATHEAMMAQATPAAAVATVPTTGGTDGSAGLLLLGIFGLVALGAGIAVRQTVRKS